MSNTTLNAYELLFKDIRKNYNVDKENNRREETKVFNNRMKLYKAIESLDNYKELMDSNLNFKTTGNLYSNKKLDSFGADVKRLAIVYERSKDKYISCNLAIIVDQLTFNNQDDYLDKFQEAAIYFQKAFNTFDINSNVLFLTYAYTYVKYGILNSHKKDDIITLRDDTRYALNRINELRIKLAPRNPTIKEIKEAFPQLSIKDIESALLHEQPIASLNKNVSINDGEGAQLIDLIKDENSIDTYEEVEQVELKELIKNIILKDGGFTMRDKKILIMRFGVGLPDEYTLEEVGQQFGITRERVRQLESKALKVLKDKYKNKLKEYY